MTSIGAIGHTAASAANAAEAAAGETDSGKDEAAAFLKQLSQTALTMASNSLMEAQDTMSDLEDEGDE